MPEKLQRFEAGSGDTLLSASRANQLVDVLNAFLALTGRNGIKVTISEGNAVIEYTGNVDATAPVVGGGGGGGEEGTWTLFGDWVDQAFDKDVVVTYFDAAALANGNVAGSYLSLQAVPMGTAAPGTAGTEAYWKLLAPYHSGRFLYKNGATKQIDLNANGTGTLPELLLVDTPSTGRIHIKVSDAAGREIKLREVNVCDSGVQKKMLVLGSEVYV